MKRKHLFLAIASVVVCGLLSSCHNGAGETSVAIGDISPLSAAKAGQLPSDCYTEVDFSAEGKEVSNVAYADGTFYYFESPLSGMRLNPECYTLKAFDVAEDKIKELYVDDESEAIADLCAFSGHLFWVATKNMGQDWLLVQFDLETEKASVLRSSWDADTQSAKAPILTVSEHWLLWDEYLPSGESRSFSIDTMMSDLEVIEAKLDARYVSSPYAGNAASSNRLYYSAKTSDGISIREAERNGTLVKQYNLPTDIAAMDISGEWLSWTTSFEVDKAEAYLCNMADSKTHRIHQPSDGWLLAARVAGNHAVLTCPYVDKGNNIYIIDLETWEKYQLLPSNYDGDTFFFPHVSYNDEIYLVGTNGHCFILHFS